jgi:large subunit ribosomal protein L16
MLSPRKEKFRKVFKGKIHGVAHSGVSFAFGCFGLRSLEPGRIPANQIEAARRCVSRCIKRERGGQFWCRIFPHTPVTSKPIEVRMGGGKGAPEKHVAKVYPGTMIFELDGVDINVARQAFTLAAAKLSCAVKFVIMEEGINVAYD